MGAQTVDGMVDDAMRAAVRATSSLAQRSGPGGALAYSKCSPARTGSSATYATHLEYADGKFKRVRRPCYSLLPEHAARERAIHRAGAGTIHVKEATKRDPKVY